MSNGQVLLLVLLLFQHNSRAIIRDIMLKAIPTPLSIAYSLFKCVYIATLIYPSISLLNIVTCGLYSTLQIIENQAIATQYQSLF